MHGGALVQCAHWAPGLRLPLQIFLFVLPALGARLPFGADQTS